MVPIASAHVSLACVPSLCPHILTSRLPSALAHTCHLLFWGVDILWSGLKELEDFITL